MSNNNNTPSLCKRIPWLPLVIGAPPLIYFVVTVAALITYLAVPAARGAEPRYVSAACALFSGIIALLLFIDIWVYHRSPFHFEMAKISIIQKVFLVIRILIAVIFAAVAVPVTIWLAVDRRYIADILWTIIAIALCIVWIALYIAKFAIQKIGYKKLDENADQQQAPQQQEMSTTTTTSQDETAEQQA